VIVVSRLANSSILRMEAICFPSCRLNFTGPHNVISQKRPLFITTDAKPQIQLSSDGLYLGSAIVIVTDDLTSSVMIAVAMMRWR
jgi:hypothetical protein